MMFHVLLDRPEDGWFVAEAPAFPGCISQGKSEKKVLENIKEAIIAWLWAADHEAIEGFEKKVGTKQVIVEI